MREGTLCGILVLAAACGDDGPSRREIVDLMLEYHSDESIYEGLTSADATRRGWIQEARALYAPLPDSSEKGVAYLRIARIHRQLGEREEAQNALAQASPLLDGEDLGRCEFERGRFLREQGLSKEAEAALRGALNLAHDVAAHHSRRHRYG